MCHTTKYAQINANSAPPPNNKFKFLNPITEYNNFDVLFKILLNSKLCMCPLIGDSNSYGVIGEYNV